MDQSNRYKCLILVIIICCILIISIPIFIKFNVNIDNSCTCTNSIFNPVKYYNIDTNSYKCICYILLPEQQNFFQTKKTCEQFNSSIWSIKDGGDEYIKLYTKLNKNTSEIWLNGRVFGSCPLGGYVCFEDLADEGHGLAIRWPYSYSITYSRLHMSTSSIKKCIYVEKYDSDSLPLWATANCEEDKYYGVCIIR